MSTSPNIPAGSTIRQSPDGSWQYQSRSVGPWLPMPAPQTQPPLPVGEKPSVAEIDAEWLATWCEETGHYDVVAFARAILARWGRPITPAAPEPSTTVRYEFEITDEHDQTMASGDAPTLEEAEREGRHYLAQYQQDGPCTLELRRVEVLDVSSPEPAPAAAAEPPLWRVMRRAYLDAPQLLDGTDRMGFAAQILAVRDRVAPEEPEPPAGDGEPWPQAYQQRSDAMWEQRQAIRALLTAEAARAEAGG